MLPAITPVHPAPRRSLRGSPERSPQTSPTSSSSSSSFPFLSNSSSPLSSPTSLKPRGIGRDLLLSVVRRSQHPPLRSAAQYEQALGRLTHLPLAHSRLTQIPALDEDDAEELQRCQGLQVAYLHDNAIQRIEGLDFAHHLTALYLSNNRLCKVEGVLHMHHLQALHLAHNRIERLEGFSPDDSSPHHDPSLSSSIPFSLPLTELHMAHQTIASPGGLTLSPASLLALPRLTFLDLSHTALRDEALSSLSLVPSLTSLLACSNPLQSLPSLLRLLPSLPLLSSLDLRQCPLTKERHYRDSVIACAARLVELDGKDVRGGERHFVREIERRRAKPRAPTREEAKEQLSGGGGGSRPRSRQSEGEGEMEEVAVVGVSTGHSRSSLTDSSAAGSRRQSRGKDGSQHSRTASLTKARAPG